MASLVIGYEDTAQGRDAVRLGGTFARALAASPLLATVFPLPAHLFSSGELERALAADEAALFARPRRSLADLEVRTRVVVDPSPAHALQGLADAEHAEMIVVGSSHRGPVGRAMLGSVGTSLLHGSACPVAVAPRDLAENHRIERIGVGFDGSPEAFSALEAAISLADRLHGASLDLFTAAEPHSYGIVTSYAILTAAEWLGAERAEKRRVLDLGLARVPGGLPARGHLVNGPAGSALAEATAGLDLMLVGSRGYGPLRRTLLGSAGVRLVHHAACPVVVLPRGVGAGTFSAGAPALSAVAG